MSRVSAPVLALTSLAAAAALAACSSSGSGGGQPPASTTAPGTTASVASSPPASGAPGSDTSSPSTSTSNTGDAGDGSATTTGSGSKSGSACAESQLRASASVQNISGLPTTHVVRLVFTNTSATSCTLTGYPGAAIEDSSGKQVQQAKRTVGGPVAGTIERVATLTVAPGRSVFAYLEGTSTREQGAAQAGCDAPKYPRILVTPPNTRTPVPFTVGWPLCYGFNVHPVRSQ